MCKRIHASDRCFFYKAPNTGKKLKERKSALATEADLAWFKLFERYDIPKRIIETEEMREAVRKTFRAVRLMCVFLHVSL